VSAASLARLVLLGAIWGGSFALIALAVPAFGPVALMALRVGLASLFLAAVGLALGHRLGFARHARHYAFVGLVNSAIPFVLLALAAQHLPASLLAVFNSLAPTFAALLLTLWLGEPVAPRARLGLLLGFLGVVALVAEALLAASLDRTPGILAAAVAAGLLAPFLYGVCGVYLRRHAERSPPAFANAWGSMIAASAALAPAAFILPPAAIPDAVAWGAAGLLGIVCTGVAYLLNFRLIADLGPVRTMTVTFLIPLFGALWSVLLLGERLGPGLLLGTPLVLAGTALAALPAPARADPLAKPPRAG